jgi:ADP-sugar diphosphatase
MLDGETFSGGAAKEIEEETGLKVNVSELIDMTALTVLDQDGKDGEKLQNAMYPSPGGCDEYIPLFLYQKRVPKAQMQEFQGKLTGLRDHGEKITLKLVPLETLWKEGARDGKTLAAWALYSGLKAEGKI